MDLSSFCFLFLQRSVFLESMITLRSKDCPTKSYRLQTVLWQHGHFSSGCKGAAPDGFLSTKLLQLCRKHKKTLKHLHALKHFVSCEHIDPFKRKSNDSTNDLRFLLPFASHSFVACSDSSLCTQAPSLQWDSTCFILGRSNSCGALFPHSSSLFLILSLSSLFSLSSLPALFPKCALPPPLSLFKK